MLDFYWQPVWKNHSFARMICMLAYQSAHFKYGQGNGFMLVLVYVVHLLYKKKLVFMIENRLIVCYFVVSLRNKWNDISSAEFVPECTTCCASSSNQTQSLSKFPTKYSNSCLSYAILLNVIIQTFMSEFVFFVLLSTYLCGQLGI